MGKLKDKLKAEPVVVENKFDEGEPTSYALIENEFNYLMNVNVVRNNLQQEMSRLMSAYLFDIAVNRLSYKPEDQLKFELDFENPKEGLKIWKLEKNFYKPTEAPQPEPQTNRPESD